MSIIWDGLNSKVIINGIQYSVSAAQNGATRIRKESSVTENSRIFFDLVRERK